MSNPAPRGSLGPLSWRTSARAGPTPTSSRARAGSVRVARFIGHLPSSVARGPWQWANQTGAAGIAGPDRGEEGITATPRLSSPPKRPRRHGSRKGHRSAWQSGRGKGRAGGSPDAASSVSVASRSTVRGVVAASAAAAPLFPALVAHAQGVLTDGVAGITSQASNLGPVGVLLALPMDPGEESIFVGAGSRAGIRAGESRRGGHGQDGRL